MDPKAELHKRVERDFTYHAPQGDQVARYNRLREKAKALAHEIIEFTPVSREQSLALTLLEQASMMANAAIARNEHQAPEEAQAESFEHWQKRHAAEDQSQRVGGAPMRQQQPERWEAMREEVKAMQLGDLQHEINQVTDQLPAIAPEQEI